MAKHRRDALPQGEFDEIFAKVPRLTVEVIVLSPRGVLLAQRDSGPCKGLWSIPGGTVRYGESLTDATRRVALDEIGTSVDVGQLLGYLEYPSHLAQGIDWPIGIAFKCHLSSGSSQTGLAESASWQWFQELPLQMHEEQRSFLMETELDDVVLTSR